MSLTGQAADRGSKSSARPAKRPRRCRLSTATPMATRASRPRRFRWWRSQSARRSLPVSKPLSAIWRSARDGPGHDQGPRRHLRLGVRLPAAAQDFGSRQLSADRVPRSRKPPAALSCPSALGRRCYDCVQLMIVISPQGRRRRACDVQHARPTPPTRASHIAISRRKPRCCDIYDTPPSNRDSRATSGTPLARSDQAIEKDCACPRFTRGMFARRVRHALPIA
jgi:hypothetical protein